MQCDQQHHRQINYHQQPIRQHQQRYSQQTNGDRFTPDELVDIFLKMIEITENYNTKAGQLKALSSIITQ